jgi:hypothetical protein
MGYVDQRLTTGEAVLYKARLHWVIFVAPALIGAAGAGLFILGRARLGAASDAFGALLLVVAALLALERWIVRSSSEFVLTNRRVLIKVGVIGRHSVEVLLHKIEGIGVDQDALGRLLGYGTGFLIAPGVLIAITALGCASAVTNVKQAQFLRRPMLPSVRIIAIER